MTSLLRRLIERSARSVNRSAAGSAVPAGIEPPPPGERPRPTAHERTLMRRRLRMLRRLDKAAPDNGGAPELESVKAEIETLQRALAELTTLDELLASGAFARCPSCGDLVAPRDHRCLHCDAELPHAAPHTRNGGEPAQEPQPAGRPHPAPAATAATGASSGRAPTQPAR